MMNGKQLKDSILQLAIQGRLVPQQPEEGTAEELLADIRREKLRLAKEGKIKKTDIHDSRIFKDNNGKYYEQTGKTTTDITKEIPFEIPETWRWCRLGDIVQINPKNHNEDEHLAAFIPMDKICATYESEYTFDTVKWGTIKKGFTHFADGDVAFAKITPCFQNKKSAILEYLPNGIGAGSSELKVLRPYGNTINRWYLLYFLETPYFALEAKFKGTANQQRIVKGYVERKLFPIPPLVEQNRLITKIQELSTHINQFCRAQNNLDSLNADIGQQLRKSILQEAVQGRLVPQQPEEGTTEELLADIRREKLRLAKEGKIKKTDIHDSRIFKDNNGKYYEQTGKTITDITKEIPFEIPETWRWCRLGDICNYGNCINIDVACIKEDNWVLELEDIEKDTGTILRKVNRGKRNIKGVRHMFEEGNVLYSKLRTYLNKVLVAPSTGFCTTEIIPFSTYSNVSSQYTCFTMRSPYVLAYTRKCGYGVKMPRLSTIDARKMLIPLPPLGEQRRIVSRIEDLFGRISNI